MFFTQAGEGKGVSLDSFMSMDQARAVYNAAYDRYMARKLRIQPKSELYIQTLGRVARTPPPPLVIFTDLAAAEKDVAGILNCKLQALDNLEQHSKSFTESLKELDKSVKPATVNSATPYTMTKQTRAQLTALDTAYKLRDELYERIESQKQTIISLRKQVDTCLIERSELKNQINTLEEQLTATAKAAGSLAAVIENR